MEQCAISCSFSTTRTNGAEKAKCGAASPSELQLVAADLTLAMTESDHYDDDFSYNDFSTTNINVETNGSTLTLTYIYSADQIYQADL